jgi:hypothetical protein
MLPVHCHSSAHLSSCCLLVRRCCFCWRCFCLTSRR